jgi:hypothetical protein
MSIPRDGKYVAKAKNPAKIRFAHMPLFCSFSARIAMKILKMMGIFKDAPSIQPLRNSSSLIIIKRPPTKTKNKTVAIFSMAEKCWFRNGKCCSGSFGRYFFLAQNILSLDYVACHSIRQAFPLVP